MSSIRYVLIAARVLIADESRWTKHILARDVDGEATNALGPEAVSWCALGAIRRASMGDEALQGIAHCEIADHLPRKARAEMMSVGRYNNTHTHADIVALFDRAIEALPVEETAAAKETARFTLAVTRSDLREVIGPRVSLPA